MIMREGKQKSAGMYLTFPAAPQRDDVDLRNLHKSARFSSAGKSGGWQINRSCAASAPKAWLYEGVFASSENILANVIFLDCC
jgi:hypothetical protein